MPDGINMIIDIAYYTYNGRQQQKITMSSLSTIIMIIVIIIVINKGVSKFILYS